MTDTEINEAVARKLGHSKEELKIWGNSPDYDYCHSIEAAWEIVEEMKHFCLDKDPDGWSVWDMAGTEEAECICKADTAPMAICLAFLKFENEKAAL